MKPSQLGFALAFLASGAQAEELDCKKAQTRTERMICADASLTLLDKLLDDTYYDEHTRRVAMEDAIGFDEKEAKAHTLELERTQQEWLETRRDKCPDVKCLKDAYRERVAAIQGVTSAGDPDAPRRGDFNFDGYEDFALYNGQNGPYSSYTYNVYLYSPEKRTYVLSEEFSALTWQSLNFFEIDTKRKRLTTFTKSGCCYHEFNEHAVRNNRPVPVFRSIQELDKNNCCTTTNLRRAYGQWRKTTKRKQCAPDS